MNKTNQSQIFIQKDIRSGLTQSCLIPRTCFLRKAVWFLIFFNYFLLWNPPITFSQSYGGYAELKMNPFNFVQMTRSDGFVSSKLFCMDQDSLGYWWFGTKKGLQRFDGHNFHTLRHKHGDPNTLPSDLILDLYTDQKGRFWVATSNGIGQLNTRTGSFIPARSKEDKMISGFPARFYEDAEGTLWYVNSSMNGRFRFLPEQEIWINEPIKPGLRIIGNRICEDRRSGDLWFLTYDGFGHWNKATSETRIFGGRLFDKDPFTADYTVSNLYIDSNNDLWLCGYKKEDGQYYILKRNLQNDQIQIFKNPIPENCVFFEDSKKRLWYFTENSPYFGYFNIDSGFHYRYRFLIEPLLAWNDGGKGITYAFEDKEGTIWILSKFGAWAFNPAHQVIRAHKAVLKPEGKVLALGSVLSFFETSKGEIWVGTYFEGIYTFDSVLNYQNKIFHTASKYPVRGLTNEGDFNAVWAIEDDCDGRIWTGGQGGTLQIFSEEGRLVKRWRLPSPNDKTIRVMK